RKAVELAKEHKMIISIDMASYNVVDSNNAFLHDIVQNYVDIVFANEFEAEAFTRQKPREAVTTISKMCKIAVVKIGKEGSLIQCGDDFYPIKAYPAKAVDATGAGDTYAAGFLYAHSLGASIEQCG
ncbi:MAG: PfkB family carbohydrate kinase, partial [Bacteroidales bacterium]